MQPIDSFIPTAHQQSYLQQKLQDVSRSFALVVPFLETPLQHYLATAYLICRVVDNIEDSGQDAEWKFQRFAEFSRLLGAPENAVEILTTWTREDWPALTERERDMMNLNGGLELWQIFAAMPPATQATTRFWVGIMTEGMKQQSDSAHPYAMIHRNGHQILESKDAYDRYCYYVAGTVGHLVTELVIVQYEFPEEVARPLRTRAEACGRALQKTNIIKDFVQDLERQVSYLPDSWLQLADYSPLALCGAAPSWTEMVLDDLLSDLGMATEYVVTLPLAATGYRRAALLCLLPAYQTVLLAARRRDVLFTSEHQIKISHAAMAQCLADSEAMLQDNELLITYSRRITEDIQDRLSQRVMVPAA